MSRNPRPARPDGAADTRRGAPLRWAAVAAAFMVALAAAGFALGRTESTDKAQARAAQRAAHAQAFGPARRAAFRRARRPAYRAGYAAGRLAAQRTGTRRGRAAGDRQRKKDEAEAAAATAAQAAAAAAESERQRSSPGCVDVGGGDCLQPGPGSGGGPCPAGTVPNADGGVVCVPIAYRVRPQSSPFGA